MEAAGVNMTINSSHKKVFIRTMIAVMLMLTMATTGILINENVSGQLSGI